METGGCEKLAFAIVLQAVKDYRRAVAKLKRKPNDYVSQKDKRECERFFVSPYCDLLLQDKFSGKDILKKLREEAEQTNVQEEYGAYKRAKTENRKVPGKRF